MKARDLICKLQELVNEHGDLDVSVADGYKYNFYQKVGDKDFEVHYFDGTTEIGVGGCELLDD